MHVCRWSCTILLELQVNRLLIFNLGLLAYNNVVWNLNDCVIAVIYVLAKRLHRGLELLGLWILASKVYVGLHSQASIMQLEMGTKWKHGRQLAFENISIFWHLSFSHTIYEHTYRDNIWYDHSQSICWHNILRKEIVIIKLIINYSHLLFTLQCAICVDVVLLF